MLPILDRSLLRELTYNMLFTLAVIVSVFFTGAAVQMLHRYPDLDLSIIGKLLPFFVLYHLEFVLPLSLLIAVVMVYGRAASQHEITTLKAGGVHPYRILLPAFFLAAIISALSVYASSELSPVASTAFKAQLKTQENLRSILESHISEGRRQLDHGGLSISWEREELPEEGGVLLHDVLIYQEADVIDPRKLAQLKKAKKDAASVEQSITRCESVAVTFDEARNAIKLVPSTGHVLQGPRAGLRTTEGAIIFKLSESRWARRLKFRTGPELVALYRRASAGEHPTEDAGEILGLLHSRVALATASLFFVLIGAPLAMVFRSSSRMVAFLLAFLVVLFVFYPTHLMSAVLVEQHLLPPILAAWSGNLLLFGLGGGLLLFVVRR